MVGFGRVAVAMMGEVEELEKTRRRKCGERGNIYIGQRRRGTTRFGAVSVLKKCG